MNEIVAVGDESFTLGFDLVGVTPYPLEKLGELLDSGDSIGIIIISQEDYDNLEQKYKARIDRLLKPIVVIMSEEDIKGNRLRDAIIRALGVDLMASNKE